MKLFRILALSLVFSVSARMSLAADWPQWRGPNRDGISSEKGLLQSWPEGGPSLAWQIVDAGGGFSTPSVSEERLFLMGNTGTDDEFVQARNSSDGGLVWSTRIGKVGENQGPQYPGARCTPTVDGDFVYVLGSDGDLASVNKSTGDIQWQKNLQADFGGSRGAWAYSESVLIDGDVLVCTPGGADATMLALDKNTGDVLWKSAIPEADQAAYSSVIVVEFGGVKQYVQFLQKGLVGLDAKTGEALWRYGRTAEGSPANIPTPIEHDGYIYSAAGRSGGGLVQLKTAGDKIEAEQVYFKAGLPTAIGGAVLLDGYLYGTDRQGLMCVEFKTGEVKWQQRGNGAGAVCFADGRLYLHEEAGQMALVEPDPEEYREVGRFTPAEQPDRGQSKAWTYPVVANGRLYVRDMNSVWSYDIEAGASK